MSLRVGWGLEGGVASAEFQSLLFWMWCLFEGRIIAFVGGWGGGVVEAGSARRFKASPLLFPDVIKVPRMVESSQRGECVRINGSRRSKGPAGLRASGRAPAGGRGARREKRERSRRPPPPSGRFALKRGALGACAVFWCVACVFACVWACLENVLFLGRFVAICSCWFSLMRLGSRGGRERKKARRRRRRRALPPPAPEKAPPPSNAAIPHCLIPHQNESPRSLGLGPYHPPRPNSTAERAQTTASDAPP
jgi:hypothetical protein